MLPLALFRIRTFAAANLLTLFLYGALSAVFFFLPFDLIQARGYSPAAAGAAVLPLIVLISVLSRWAGTLADRFGPRLPLTLGPATVAAGFFLLALLPADGRYAATVLPALCVLGLGMAATVAPLTATVLNAVGRGDQGIASGINNAVARVAALLAIAFFGIRVMETFRRSLDERIVDAEISPATVRALAPERTKLGAMRPPAAASPGEKQRIERAVRESLDSSFRFVAAICGGLALLAAASAAVGIERRAKASPLHAAGEARSAG